MYTTLHGQITKRISRVLLHFIWALCFASLMLAFPQAVFAQPLPSGVDSSEIGSRIEAFAEEHVETTAGMAVAVIDGKQPRGQHVIYQGAFGFADKEAKVAVDADETVFEWGSCTKMLVWVAVMQQVERGALDLDVDIATYLPENFLSNVRFSEPITLINLMNHDAGFQELVYDLMTKDFNLCTGLEDALLHAQPTQVFAPGTYTAYSNWGCALAAYIVERVSGQDFAAYVHEHIFSVLNMEHTAILPDLSDCPWVQQRRGALQSYLPDGTLLPNVYYYIPLYACGMATGTIGDFAAFAAALANPVCPLFANPETRDSMFSPTSSYANGMPRNAHGFWVLPFASLPLGHGGNTTGCSSYLLVDVQSSIAAVVMTNQAGEEVYNTDMMELVFGEIDETLTTLEPRALPKGFWRSARTVLAGPLKAYSAGYMLLDESQKEEFWVESSTPRTIQMPYFDFVSVPLPALIGELASLLLWVVGIVFSLGHVVASAIAALVRRKRGVAKPDAQRGLRRGIAVVQLALFGLVAYMALAALSMLPSSAYRWVSPVIGLVIIGLVVLLVLLVRGGAVKTHKALNAVTSIFALITIVAVFYWNLPFFWIT